MMPVEAVTTINQDVNTKILICQVKNALFNNNLVKWDETEEFYNNCKFYIKNTISLENSPWSKDISILSSPYYHKIKLSVLQKKIIKHLHENFFKWGNPSYLKMETLSIKLKTKRQSIQRAITSLEKRQILKRIPIYSEKLKNHRTILLPNNPIQVKISNIIKYKDNKLLHPSIKLLHPRCNSLICKLPKSLQEKAVKNIYNIYTSNTIYTQLSIFHSKTKKIPSESTDGVSRQFMVKDSFSLTKKGNVMQRLPRYKLQVKPSINKSIVDSPANTQFEQMLQSVDYDIFKLTEVQRKSILFHIEKNTFDFTFSKVFKNLNAYNTHAKKYDRKLLSFYLKLFFNNEPLDHSVTEKILIYWNNTDNPKFTKHLKLANNPEAISYAKILILTNYVLKFVCGNDISWFFTSIDRIEGYGAMNFHLANNLKKWKLDNILMLHDSNGMKKYFFIKDKKEFDENLFEHKSKYTDASKRFKSIWMNRFYDDLEKGEFAYSKYKSKLDTFLDMLINRIKERRELYRLNLTQVKNIDGFETDSILGDYCDWFSYSVSGRMNNNIIFEFCDYQNFLQFVNSEMRGIRGYENFWKIIQE